MTDLQWEFFFTAWRYNLDFWRGSNVRWKFDLGVPLYYYLLARKLFGTIVKYPLLRVAHFPEGLLRDKLYLNFGDGRAARYQIPDRVEIPAERLAGVGACDLSTNLIEKPGILSSTSPGGQSLGSEGQ